jgi:[acyl-carrier-protein] S-malonyltransferase
MGKTAFLFPGQGSQKVGMGAELLDARPDVFDRYVDQAEEASGLPIRTLCLEGPIEELTRTEVAQPALFAVSLAVVELARESGLAADLVAGHSLGEYTAAVVSGALDLDDGMPLVAQRGRLMADIQSERPGAMGAVIGLPAEQVEELCRQASDAGTVRPANFNTPAQIIVSGEEAAVLKVIELAEQAGAKKALRLQVGAAFHSELMEPVQRKLGEAMDAISWNDPETPLVSNASGKVVATGEEVHRALVAQIASPVLWVDCVETMVANGCDTFLELGPGRVLSGLVRQIDSAVESFPADSPGKLATFKERAGA